MDNKEYEYFNVGNGKGYVEVDNSEVSEVEEGIAPVETGTFTVSLTLEEKIRCLQEIESKLKKILYVYDKSQEPNSQYNYKVYCGGVLIYVSSSNVLFGGELVSIVVNLNAILTNNFSKAQIKRIVFESKNYAQYLATNYKSELDKESHATSNS